MLRNASTKYTAGLKESANNTPELSTLYFFSFSCHNWVPEWASLLPYIFSSCPRTYSNIESYIFRLDEPFFKMRKFHPHGAGSLHGTLPKNTVSLFGPTGTRTLNIRVFPIIHDTWQVVFVSAIFFSKWKRNIFFFKIERKIGLPKTAIAIQCG